MKFSRNPPYSFSCFNSKNISKKVFFKLLIYDYNNLTYYMNFFISFYCVFYYSTKRKQNQRIIRGCGVAHSVAHTTPVQKDLGSIRTQTLAFSEISHLPSFRQQA